MASVTLVDRFVLQAAADLGGPSAWVNVRDMATGFIGIWTKEGQPVHGRLTRSAQAPKVAAIVERHFAE